MVAPVHHATVKKAAALGFTVEGSHDDDCYTVVVGFAPPVRAETAPAAVEDARVLQMLRSEFPAVRARQNDDMSWDILHKGATVVESVGTLTQAWEDASEMLAEQGEDLDEPYDDGSDEAEQEDGLSDELAEADEAPEQEDGDDEAERTIVKPKFRARYRDRAVALAMPKEFKQTCCDTLARDLREYLWDGENDQIDAGRLRHLAEANGVWADKYANLNVGQRRMNVGNRLRNLVKKGGEIVWPGQWPRA